MAAKQQGRGAVVREVNPEIDLTVTEAAWKAEEKRIRAAEETHARVDITTAAAIAIAGARNVLARREELAEAFRAPKLTTVEGIERVAHAAQHADLVHRAAQDPEAPFADLLPRANELRGMLLDDLVAQVRRKRAPKSLLDDIRAGDNSARDKANDLNDLAVWYRANWDSLGGKTTVEGGEITEASALAATLIARIGAVLAARSKGVGELDTGALRRRAFALLLQEYAVVRRYGAYLFFEEPEGWEAYVPSLFAARGSTRAGEEPEEPVEPQPTPDPKPA